jgi:ABC-type antimicrobial peptide transport system permease subunit
MSGSDPIVLVGSAAALAFVALAAGFVPALKASRVEPMRALRYE